MRKKLLQNILFAAMAAWAIYGSGLTAPLGFDEAGGHHLVAAQALR